MLCIEEGVYVMSVKNNDISYYAFCNNADNLVYALPKPAIHDPSSMKFYFTPVDGTELHTYLVQLNGTDLWMKVANTDDGDVFFESRDSAPSGEEFHFVLTEVPNVRATYEISPVAAREASIEVPDFGSDYPLKSKKVDKGKRQRWKFAGGLMETISTKSY